jgi:hypothetical protein
MIPLFIVQLLVPAALLAWLLLAPPRSLLAAVVQIGGSLLLILGLTRIGLWLFPPWWVPAVSTVAVALAGVWIVRRRSWTSAMPGGALAWARVALFVLAGVAGGYWVARARTAGRLPDDRPPVDLAFPLEQGRYLVVNGGAWTMINAHRASMDSTVVRLRDWRGNGHAVDIVAIDAVGSRASGVLPEDPAAYRIFGVRVLAPCAGNVVAAVDGVRDLPVPQQDLENKAGNHVILECGGVHVVLAHFRQGSLRVEHGETVEAGEWIGSVGNSGMSTEPHLHIHAQLPGPRDSPMAGDPLPMRLGGRYLVRGDRVKNGPAARTAGP